MTTEQPTIESMNRVISEFMEGVFQKDRNNRWVYRFGSPPGNVVLYTCLVNSLIYHSDWSWLMPVWRKLKEWKKKAYDVDHPKEFEGFKEDWMLSCYCVDIIGAHRAVYDAILWHNTHK